jgi:hypothetical protein
MSQNLLDHSAPLDINLTISDEPVDQVYEATAISGNRKSRLTLATYMAIWDRCKLEGRGVLNATFAHFDRRNHGNAPGAALPEASCADGGCGFMDHVTLCYYVIN